jgi:hypothetical protein
MRPSLLWTNNSLFLCVQIEQCYYMHSCEHEWSAGLLLVKKKLCTFWSLYVCYSIYNNIQCMWRLQQSIIIYFRYIFIGTEFWEKKKWRVSCAHEYFFKISMRIRGKNSKFGFKVHQRFQIFHFIFSFFNLKFTQKLRRTWAKLPFFLFDIKNLSWSSDSKFLLSSYMEYIESIGFTPKKKFFFAQIMFFADKNP